MNSTFREIITQAILKEFRLHGPKNQEHILQDSLKWIVNDASLVCFAQDLGIDTDRLLKVLS